MGPSLSVIEPSQMEVQRFYNTLQTTGYTVKLCHWCLWWCDYWWWDDGLILLLNTQKVFRVASDIIKQQRYQLQRNCYQHLCVCRGFCPHPLFLWTLQKADLTPPFGPRRIQFFTCNGKSFSVNLWGSARQSCDHSSQLNSRDSGANIF